MSIEVVGQTNNQAHFKYDYSKIFIFDNRYEVATFINLTGGALDYPAGTVVGMIAATGKITNLKSGAADGSELPIGVLATDITALAGSGEILVNMCTAGDIEESKLTFDGSDDLTTIVAGRRLRERLAADTVGIVLKSSTELTDFDNE